VTKNTADIVTKIKNFIDEYNTIVTHLNDLIKGKVIRKNGAIEYPPLTEEERKALSAEEVKLYEEKAKSGIMANDSQLRKILNDMRTAIYQKVEGVGISMSDIGITSSANYMDGGLLVVDETKLKAALDKNYDGVVSLFTKASSIPYSDKKNSDKRAAESGIAQRLNDIFTAAAGTSAGGEKGYLLEKAGMVNDRTQADNAITKQLNDYDKKIDKMLERWYRQEQNYYMMFARMETAMSKLQAQQNSLAQIMAAGAGGGK
jgi:flagellar hook-associated protein 2